MPDNKEYSIGKSKSPYKIKQAPPFKRDNSKELEAAFYQQRSSEESHNNQHKQLIGNLDSLSGDFVALSNNFTTIRQKLYDSSYLPLKKRKHSLILRMIIKYVDKINGILIAKIIPLIDKLGR